MKKVFKRPESLTEKPFHFCPGCHHGIAHRMVAEAIDHLGNDTATTEIYT